MTKHILQNVSNHVAIYKTSSQQQKKRKIKTREKASREFVWLDILMYYIVQMILYHTGTSIPVLDIIIVRNWFIQINLPELNKSFCVQKTDPNKAHCYLICK